MRPMRSVLLWMARNERLEHTIPSLPFARRAVRRFMPGDDGRRCARGGRAAAVTSASASSSRTSARTSPSLAEADAVLAHYRSVLELDAGRPPGRPPSRSPSSPPSWASTRTPTPAWNAVARSPPIARRVAPGSGSTWKAPTTRTGPSDLCEAPPARPSQRRHRHPGVSAAHGGRRPAAAALRAGHPPRQGRLRRARRHRLSRPCRGRRQLPGPGPHRRRAGRPRGGPPRAGHPRRGAHRADPHHHRRPGRARLRAGGPHAVRHPGARAAAACATPASRPSPSSPTARPGTAGTCAASPSAPPTSCSPCASCCPDGNRSARGTPTARPGDPTRVTRGLTPRARATVLAMELRGRRGSGAWPTATRGSASTSS